MDGRIDPKDIIREAFQGITPEDAEELIASSRINKYPDGTALCHEDALEDTFYLLLEGEVEVTKVINNVERRQLKKLDSGSFFGEMALIHNAPRAATVTARGDVIVLEIQKGDFNRVLHHSGSVSLAMVREISNRLRENDEMAIGDLRLRAGELARAYQKLAEQELARREFLTNIAHELRTPLMAAGGYLQFMQKGMIPANEMASAVDTVARNVQQINTLVNDILFMQEMDLILPKFQAVDMIPLAATVIKSYSEKAEVKQVKLKLDSPPSLPNVSGDPRSLERAITALVDNAIKFSPNNGTVTIKMELADSQLLLHVIDQGIGIEPEKMAKIFDRFYHLEKSGDDLFSGIGMGLSVTRQVIEQHNGTLDVKSEPNKGTTFTMRLNIIRVMI